MTSLTEDEIDDFLYAARVNEPAELLTYLTESAPRHGDGTNRFEILASAVESESGNTVLHYAAANGHVDIILLSCALFTNPSLSPNDLSSLKEASTTIQSSALSSSTFETFINRTNAAGNTALHWASLNGHLSAVQLLVKFGANPAITNGMGHDPVFEAERNDKEEIVKWFLAEVPGLEQAVGTDTHDSTGDGDAMDVEEVEATSVSGPGDLDPNSAK